MSQIQLSTPSLREKRTPTRVGQSYFIKTYGCQMNVHDSEGLAGMLAADGMSAVEAADLADVVVLNTCCIRENADNKLYGTLGALKPLKDANPKMAIAVGGCLAQKDKDGIQARAPWVDVVFGTHNIGRLVSLLDHAQEWGPITEIWDESDDYTDLPRRREVAHAGWINIMIGCNNSCTFCIVPAVRGGEISRRPADIIAETRKLASDGVVEVTLLGQNVNSYGRDLELNGRKPLFADLLRQVGRIDGIERIRFTSPHPKDFKEDVAQAMAETPAVCEQLHLPLQSGSDRVLAAMHRGYNAERFLSKVELARNYMPGLGLSTDIIVGFPGESDDEFEATLEVVEAAQFDSAFTFVYSPRPGTAAAAMKNDFVDPEVIQHRYQRLIDLQYRISEARNRELVGHQFSLLSEGPSKKDPSVVASRTRSNKLVHVQGEMPAGAFFDATITGAGAHYLTGASG